MQQPLRQQSTGWSKSVQKISSANFFHKKILANSLKECMCAWEGATKTNEKSNVSWFQYGNGEGTPLQKWHWKDSWFF
jgi:hypothetical protein